MAGQQKPPQTPKQPTFTGAEDTGWDLVDESSWESFPASDSPSWATPSTDTTDVHPSRPLVTESPGEQQKRGGKDRAMHPLRPNDGGRP